MITHRITLNEAALLLDLDRRTVKKRSLKKGISLYSNGPNTPAYMALVQFEYAFNEEIITDLRKRYGASWYDVYQAYKDNNLKRMVNIIDHLNGRKQPTANRYKLSKREQQIIFDLTGKTAEL